MAIPQLLQDARFGEPLIVHFGYAPGIDDPPEIQAVMGMGRAMPWADARPALVALGSKHAPIVRVDTTDHTVRFGHDGNRWRILEEQRLTPAARSAAVAEHRYLQERRNACRASRAANARRTPRETATRGHDRVADSAPTSPSVPLLYCRQPAAQVWTRG